MYLIPLRFPRPEALRLLAAALMVTAAGLTVFGLVRHGADGPGGATTATGLLAEGAVAIVGAWLIGYSVRQQRAYAAGQQELTWRRAREEVAEMRRATSEERLRIARELHDVVAHSMSVIACRPGSPTT